MKRLLLLSTAIMYCYLLGAQIQVTSLNNGIYSYNSLYQAGDLHFYLYNDGHHSFNPSNVHQFGDHANGNIAKAYHSEPYDVDQVEELSLNYINDGAATPMVPSYDLPNKVALKRSWSLVNSEDNYFILMFENNESPTAISGCVEFHYTSGKSQITPSEMLDNYGNSWVDPQEDHQQSEYQGFTDKFVWEFENLQPQEQRFIYIPAICLANGLEIVETMAIMKVNNCEEMVRIGRDGDGANPGITNSSYYTLRSQVKNYPHDPNAIVTDPNCLVEVDDIQTVRYKIYFQNEGVDPVVNVIVDFLVNTPFLSIELKEASHYCQMYWAPKPSEFDYSENVKFVFENIYLKGLAALDPPLYEETVGWATVDICFSLKAFTYHAIDCAESNINIFFDLEPPVSATNTICRDCGNYFDDDVVLTFYDCPDILPEYQEFEGFGNKVSSTESVEINTDNDLIIYPNPASDLLFLDDQNLEEMEIIMIRNSSGNIVLKASKSQIEKGIDISTIPSGIYYISVQNKDSVKTKAFVKQ